MERDAWAYKPTRWDRITAWPFEGGILRTVLSSVGLVVLVLALVVALSIPGERYQARQRAALVALCDLPTTGGIAHPQGGIDDAPTTADGRAVRHHAGTVVARPSAAGYWGDNDGPNRPLGQVVFVQVEGRDEPIGVRQLPGKLPAAGTQLRFCAIDDGARFWWPIVGYDSSGWGEGRLYGEPSGPFAAVEWLTAGPATGIGSEG